MPERQSRHPDNEMIDRMQEEATPAQQGSAGGNVNRTVGTRAELDDPEGDASQVERERGSDNPEQDASKGKKTSAAIQQQRNNS